MPEANLKSERLSQIKYIRNEGTASEQLIEQIDYSFDAKGQIKARTTRNNHGTGLQDTPFTATHDAANRMTVITLNVGATPKSYTLTHDANGNLTTKQNTADPGDTTTYTWDSNNRLIGISQPSLNASFTYDAFGRRIQSSITQGGQTRTVQYVYEGLQALGEVRDGKLSHRLLTGLSLDETIARIAINSSGQKDTATSRLFMTDALNSVIAQMNDDETASLANSYGYSPYGESQTIGPDATGNPIQYTSRENDGTGLVYYRARHYDPVLKRFISEDPIGLAGGWNMFAYVEGNPLSFIDPEGLGTIYDDGAVRMVAYPGPNVPGGREHARWGPGGNYHVHFFDSAGREARISSETWRPLTPEDAKVFNQSKQMQRACEGLSDGEKKFLDRVNRHVFHRGGPSVNQLSRLGGWRGRGGGPKQPGD